MNTMKNHQIIKLQITDHFGGWITLFEKEAKDHRESVNAHKLVQLKINEIRSQAKDPRISRNFPPRGKALRKTANGLVQYEEHFRSTYQGIS